MRAPTRHILGLGGGGWGMADEPHLTPLDEYALRLTRKRRPKVCFIPTASGDSPEYIERFHAAFPEERAVVSVLRLFQRDGGDLREQVLGQDLLYVGGGNTANLLAIWRAHKLPPILREAYDRGIVCCGISAGMLCWFRGGITDSFGDFRAMKDGLGFLPYAGCPHFDGEAGRQAVARKAVAAGRLPELFAVDDGVAVHFENERLHRVVAEWPSRCARHLIGDDERMLSPQMLRSR